MNLDDYLLGTQTQPSMEVDFQPRSIIVKPPEVPVPFQTKCENHTGITIDEAQCGICPNLHRGRCLKAESHRMAPLSVSLFDTTASYSKTASIILSDLAIQLLQGKPWSTFKKYLASRYPGPELTEVASEIKPWLKNPGVLGYVLIDPDIFGSCRQAQEKLSGLQLKPPYVLKKDRCTYCNSNIGDKCLRFNAGIYTEGDTFKDDGLETILRMLLEARLITSKTVETAISFPFLKAIKFVALSVINFEVQPNEDLYANITSLGEEVNPQLHIFNRETPESIEAKNLFLGNEMHIDVDPPPQESIKRADNAFFHPGAGIDGYIGTLEDKAQDKPKRPT